MCGSLNSLLHSLDETCVLFFKSRIIGLCSEVSFACYKTCHKPVRVNLHDNGDYWEEVTIGGC